MILNLLSLVEMHSNFDFLYISVDVNTSSLGRSSVAIIFPSPYITKIRLNFIFKDIERENGRYMSIGDEYGL